MGPPYSTFSWADEQAIRTRAVELLESWVGLGPPPNPRALDYLRTIYPLDTDADRYAMARLSSCALTALAMLRALGCDDPRLAQPYTERIGLAVSDVMGVARSQNAWVDTTAWQRGGPLPEPGDVVLIGRNGGGAAWGAGPLTSFEHVVCVTGYEGSHLLSVDGGQPGIAARSREVVETGGGELWLGAVGAPRVPGQRPSHGRRVIGYVSLARLSLPVPPLDAA